MRPHPSNQDTGPKGGRIRGRVHCIHYVQFPWQPVYRLTEQRDGVEGVGRDLNLILDSPLLQRLTDTHLPSPAATVVHSKAEVLHMRTQSMAGELDKLVSELQDRMDRQREGIIADLEELEAWLSHTYSVVLLEPNRYLYPAGLVDEDGLGPDRSEESSTFDEGEAWQQRRASDASAGSADVSGGSVEGEGEAPTEGGDDDDGGGGGGGGEEGGVVNEGEVGVVSEGKGGVVGREEEKEFSVEFSMSAEGGEGVENEEEGEGGVNGREEVVSPTSTHTETITSGEGSSEVDKSQSDETGLLCVCLHVHV